MHLSKSQKSLLERVINVFETGTPEGNYSAVSIYADGPHGIRQITYGRSQTTEYGNLRQLVQDYAHVGATYSAALLPYVDKIGNEPLTDDATFKKLLKAAGKNDRFMRAVQDSFFDRVYFQPALDWATAQGFVEVLSGLVIYDSFIHSGGILWFLRNRFAETTPAAGGSERKWIKAYVRVRDEWLRTHSNTILQKTVYRTECFQREIDRGNWDLSRRPIVANGSAVDLP